MDSEDSNMLENFVSQLYALLETYTPQTTGEKIYVDEIQNAVDGLRKNILEDQKE